MKNKNLYLLLLAITLVIVLLPSFKTAPTSDYDIVVIRGKEFIRSKVSGGYVYTKIN